MKAKDMTPAQKRVAIAKDVIAQIELKTIKPANDGWYLYSLNRGAWTPPSGTDVQSVIPALGKCTVCAVGAAFLSGVRLFDGVKSGSNTLNGLASNRIKKWFGRNQRCEIENAFETDYLDIRSPAKRLTVIMRNIIRNRGKFIPTTKDFPKGAPCKA